MPKISARTLEEHRSETVDRLLDAFAELVKSKGFANVSLADVAAQAGLARTAIYNYFPDRETLLFAWTDREVRRALSILKTNIEEAETSAEKLRVFVHLQLIDFAHRHLPPGQEVVQFLQPTDYGRFRDHIEPLERILVDILNEGARSGEFTSVDISTNVPMILACIGAERAPLASKVHEVEEATERVTGFLLRALGAQAKSRAAKKKPPAKRAR